MSATSDANWAAGIRPAARETKFDIESFTAGSRRLTGVLQQMGYTELRKGQDDIVAQLIGGRDTIGVLPTSLGKTLCFVVPGLSMQWKTIVFSPLVALMRDQVQGLQRKGIAAAQMSSVQNEAENLSAARRWASGELDFLYVAPERLRNEVFKEVTALRPPDFVAIDECHVVSEWSDNFRPDYAKIDEFIYRANPKVVAAFTATMPLEVERDVRRAFHIPNASKILYYPRRNNLKLSSGIWTGVSDLIRDLEVVGEDGSFIVYCSAISRVTDYAVILQDLLGEDVTVFHGQLTPTVKKENMDRFMNGDVRGVVATNAFGMGIDKSNIRAVISADLPKSIEDLAQLLGRAGRDGKNSWCKTYFSKESRRTQEFFIKQGHPSRGEIEMVYRALRRLADSSGYVHESNTVLSQVSGVKPNVAPVCKFVLAASKVLNVVRTSADEKRFMIHFKGSLEDAKFRLWQNIITSYGEVSDSQPGYQIEQGVLSEQLGVDIKVVRKQMREWEDKKVVSVIDPPRANPVQVVGGIELVDFVRLDQRRQEAYEKLDQAQEYCLDVEDAQKHAFIENAFGIKNNS